MLANKVQFLLICFVISCVVLSCSAKHGKHAKPRHLPDQPQADPDIPNDDDDLADSLDPTTEPPAVTEPPQTPTDSPMDSLPADIFNTTHNICANLRSIRDLIPQDVLHSLIGEHYMRDTRFRRAMDFMKTASFKVAAARFSNSNPYQMLLSQLRRSGVEVVDLETLIVVFNCIIVMPTPVIASTAAPQQQPQSLPELPLLPFNDPIDAYYPDDPNFPPLFDYPDYGSGGMYYRRKKRSLQSFAMDFMSLLPKEQLRAIFKANMERNTEFGKFYKIIRKQRLQRSFLRQLNSRQMTAVNRSFRRHSIDVRRLVATFFRIINKGPLPTMPF